MGTIIPFPRMPRAPRPTGPSGVRVAMVADQWCVELVSNGAVIRWTRMPSCEDAVRVAGRVSLRDRAERLPMVIPGDRDGPDDH